MPIKFFMCITCNQIVRSLETDYISGMHQPVASAHLVLKIVFVWTSVYVCVSPFLRRLTISGVMWHDMDPVCLVKQVYMAAIVSIVSRHGF